MDGLPFFIVFLLIFLWNAFFVPLEVFMLKKFHFVFFLFFFAVPSVFAAPPFFQSVPEPAEQPAVSMVRERFAQSMQSAFFAPVSYPTPTVTILFLRVDFQQDSDPQTSGNGTWLDPAYSLGVSGTPSSADNLSDPSNFWVTRAQANFVNFWREVSYGLLPIQVDISARVYRLPNTLAYYGNETNSAL